jgi:hypothetical protein
MKKLTVLLMSVAFVGCTENTKLPKNVYQTLHTLPEQQQSELAEVIEHYEKKTDDSTKLKACYFLIENIKLIKTKTPISSTKFISNIDLAFSAWKNNPDYGQIDFETFCHYILPPTIFSEEFEDWRSKIHHQYDSVVNPIPRDSAFSIKVISAINNDMMKWFSFSSEGSDFTWSQLSEYKNGDCASMAKIIALAARAYGIPVAIDFTPVWGNINGYGHIWNALLLPQDKIIPFMGAENNPGDYSPFSLVGDAEDNTRNTYKKSCKIFRYTFSIKGNERIKNLVLGENDLFPEHLRNPSMIDVTKQYVPVTDVTLNLKPHKNNKVVFLSVINFQQWMPVTWSELSQEGNVVFDDMARGVVYCPSYSTRDKGVVMADYPHVITMNGAIVRLAPDTINVIDISLSSPQSIELDQGDLFNKAMDNETRGRLLLNVGRGKDRSVFKNNTTHTLYYFAKHGWRIHSGVKSNTGSVAFANVPANALYKVLPEEATGKERIFVIENNKVVWY